MANKLKQLELSNARSARVARYFMAIGVEETRVFPTGLGARDPVASNGTAAGRARNRRVEIIVQSAVVNQTLDNALLDKTPTTTRQPIRTTVEPRVVTKVGPTTDIRPHLGPS